MNNSLRKIHFFFNFDIINFRTIIDLKITDLKIKLQNTYL